MSKQATVIIPNYNGLKFLPDCMGALEKQIEKDFDILVVDNGSEDGSKEWLKEHGIHSVFLPENTGFSGAVNTGIEHADTEFVILLNNDTIPEPEFVGALLRSIKRSAKIFSVSSRMMQMYHPELVDDAGDLYSLPGWAFQRGVGQQGLRYMKECSVFSSCAGAAIYRRAVFDTIGLFDQLHFAYLEDIDVGYRARIYGYQNLYCPDAVVYHVGSGTSGSKYNSFKVKLAARNNLYLNYKNMPNLQLAVNSIFLLTGIVVKYFFFKKMGFKKDYVAGLREGIFTLHKAKRVPYKKEHLKNYLALEWQMITGTVIYLKDYLLRRL